MRRLLPALSFLVACSASGQPSTGEPGDGSAAGAAGAAGKAGAPSAGQAGAAGTPGFAGAAGVAAGAGGTSGAAGGGGGAAGAAGSPFGGGGTSGAAGTPSCATPVPVAGNVSLGGAPCVSDPSSDYLCDSFCGGDYAVAATCTKGMGPPSALMTACAQAGFGGDTYCCRTPVCKPATHACPSGLPFTCSPGLYPKMTYSCKPTGGDPAAVCCSPT